MPLRRAGRWAALVVALVGLFAMHGLADHGTASHGSMAGTAHSPVLMDSSVHHGDHAATEDAPAGGHRGNTGLLELCVAILGAALLLATALVLRRRVVVRRLLLVDRELAAWWARARDPAPPDLYRLSVQRC